LVKNYGSIDVAVPQADGNVLIGGSFVIEGSQTRVSMARLSADGAVDPLFFTGVGPDSSPKSIFTLPDARILVAGSFSKFDDRNTGGLVILKGDAVTAPPPTPAGLTVDALSSTILRVSWLDQQGETGWMLERSLDGVSGWQAIAEPNWTATSFTDTGLLPDRIYHYRLRGLNSAGASEFSSIAYGSTLSRFVQWKLNHGFAREHPEDDDGDRDGILLSLEYALGLDPAVGSTDGMPVHQLLNGAIALSYRKQRAEVQYVVESSEDMINWSSADVHQGTGSFPIAWSMIANASQKFLRLRVVIP
jgi:hypothetical protein